MPRSWSARRHKHGYTFIFKKFVDFFSSKWFSWVFLLLEVPWVALPVRLNGSRIVAEVNLGHIIEFFLQQTDGQQAL